MVFDCELIEKPRRDQSEAETRSNGSAFYSTIKSDMIDDDPPAKISECACMSIFNKSLISPKK